MKLRNVFFCSASAVAMVLAASPALAQNDSDQIETVVVTGIRASIERSLENKRDSSQVIESIVTEDIGKLPDNNIVEAMQRVTGVQVSDRTGGEVSTVYIRGMPDVTTTWQGRNLFTSSGRLFSIQDMPSTLVDRVDVYKTRSADQIETGIAGQIDVGTHRPFDFDGFRLSAAYRGTYMEQRGSFDPNFSLLVSDTWNTGIGKIGLLVNLSYLQTRFRDESVTAGAMVPFMTENPGTGYTPLQRIFVDWQAGLNAGLPEDEGSTLTVGGEVVEYLLGRDAVFQSDFKGNRERPAAVVSLQWQPSESSTYTLEMLYDGYRVNTFNNLFFTFVDWWGGISTDPDEAAATYTTYPGTNIIKTRTLPGGAYGFVSGDVTSSRTNTVALALNAKWDFTDRLKVQADVMAQESDWMSVFRAMRTERWSDVLTFDLNHDDGIPSFSFADETLLTDPTAWNTAQFYDNGYHNHGAGYTMSVDAEYDLKGTLGGFGETLGLTRIKAGVRLDERNASEAERTQWAYYSVAFESLDEGLQYYNKGFFDGYDVPHSWVAPSGYYLLKHPDEIRSLYGLTTADGLSYTRNFTVDETNYTVYALVDFAPELFGKPLQGEVGLRIVKINTGMEFVGETAHAKASAVLPSVTLRYDLMDDLMVRFNYGETLRRPNFTDLNPNYDTTDDLTNVGYGTGTAGNPYLTAGHAKNYDFTMEWYFEPGSALYATAFQRDITGLVVSMRKVVNMTIAGNSATKYVITMPTNASKGRLQGLELGLVYFPKYLPGWFDGLGFQGSLTLLNSDQNVPNTDEAGNVISQSRSDFIGVSNYSYNSTLVYEKGDVGMRLSYVWRNHFYYGNEAALFANPIGIWRRPESSLDFQVNYKILDGKAMVTFDGTNLLESKMQSYYKFGNAGGSQIANFGNNLISRTFTIGLRYSLD